MSTKPLQVMVNDISTERATCKNCGCPSPKGGEVGLYCSACGAGIDYGGNTYLFNTSILTSHGVFRYIPIFLPDARSFAAAAKSAIGHQATADILTDLLGVPVEVNRTNAQQRPGDIAVVFKLRGRPQEGKILSREEVEAIGYDFGLLVRLE